MSAALTPGTRVALTDAYAPGFAGLTGVVVEAKLHWEVLPPGFAYIKIDGNGEYHTIHRDRVTVLRG